MEHYPPQSHRVALVILAWMFLAAPIAAADTADASNSGLQRATIAVKHAVSEAFPQIEHFAGIRADLLGDHEDGIAVDIPIPGDPTSAGGIALGDEIRDFLVERSGELGVVHVTWRQILYRADGVSEPTESRGGLVADHHTHLHVTTVGGGIP